MKKLILVVDRDNDLGEKAGLEGPLVGKEKVREAILLFGQRDPTDSDLNAMLQALKLAEEVDGEVAVITGDRRMGYWADRKIVEQLESLKEKFGNLPVIFVSDGASDDVVLPLISARFPLESVQRVVVRQAAELEKTYVLLLEKLRDPHYARILFGIPAILLLAIGLISLFGIKWQFLTILLGLYLIAKAFSLDEEVMKLLGELKGSGGGISWIGVAAALPLILISLWISYDALLRASALPFLKKAAYFLRPLVSLAPWGLGMLFAGRAVEEFQRGNELKAINYAFYIFLLAVSSYVLLTAVRWILNEEPPYVSFGDFLGTVVGALILSYLAGEAAAWLKTRLIKGKKLAGMQVFSTKFGYLGTCERVSSRGITVRTPAGERLFFPFRVVEEVSSRVLVS